MLGSNMSIDFIGDEYTSFDISKLTTIRVGKVSTFVKPKSLSDLRLLIKKCNKIKAILGRDQIHYHLTKMWMG